MPSDFMHGQAALPKTLEDLITQITMGKRAGKSPFSSSPTAPPGRFRIFQNRAATNKETERQRQERAASEALRTLREL